MNRKIVPVILSGGSGTRLWPLSTPERPKQFLPLVTERTLFQDTLLRLRGLGDLLGPPVVVCNAQHERLVADQLDSLDIAPGALILEPAGRNTAPAVALAALRTLATGGEGSASGNAADLPLLLVLPADHAIRDEAAFVDAVRIAAAAAAGGSLVTFGVVPHRPETGYGYIRKGDAVDTWYRLDEFVEKPDIDTAIGYLRSGLYLWNSGMFMLPPELFIDELGIHAPAMLAACRAVLEETSPRGPVWPLADSFGGCPADSIDYAVMEKTSSAAVVPLDAGWSDVGSWPALYEMLDKDEHGNVVRGDALADRCANSLVLADAGRVAVAGLSDTVVVAAGGNVLVVPMSAAQDVKKLAQ